MGGAPSLPWVQTGGWANIQIINNVYYQVLKAVQIVCDIVD